MEGLVGQRFGHWCSKVVGMEGVAVLGGSWEFRWCCFVSCWYKAVWLGLVLSVVMGLIVLISVVGSGFGVGKLVELHVIKERRVVLYVSIRVWKRDRWEYI